MPAIYDEVLEQLAGGPKTPEQLLAAIPVVENTKQLANCLYKLRTSGAATRAKDGSYTLTKNKKEPEAATANHRAIAATMGVTPERVANDFAAASATPAAQTYIDTLRPIGATASVVAPLSKKQTRKVFAEVAVQSRKARALKDIAADFNKPRPAVRAILEKSVHDNQAALDDYVASVADPRILGPLRNARDQARAALAALDAMENKP